MADYKTAFSQIRENPELAQKFVNDPKGTLASLGVDASKLTAASGGSASQASVCVGCGICVG